MTAEGAIILIWSVTLIVALVGTAFAVAIIVRIVHAAREIDRQLKETLPSAVGIVNHTAAIRELDAVVAAAGPLLEGTAAIKAATAGIEQKVTAVGPTLIRLVGGARP